MFTGFKLIPQMRVAMGMLNETDPLPAPRLSEATTTEQPTWEVPDWQAAIGDEANSRVIESSIHQAGDIADCTVDEFDSAGSV